MKTIKKIIGIFAVMNGVGLGVAVFLQTHLGSDPIGILCEGVHKSLNIQFGHASLLYNFLLIGLAFVCAKKNLGIGSIAYALLSGYFIEFYSWILSASQLASWVFTIRLLVFILGLFVFTMSLAVLIRFEFGMNALDALLYQLSTQIKIPYVVLRLLVDYLYVLVGYQLGGIFGIGSVICVLTSGLLIKGFNTLLTNKERAGRKGTRRYTSNEV